MVRRLPADGLLVVNHDDENTLWMAGETRARRVTFGFHAASDYRAIEPRIVWPHGTEFKLRYRGRETTVRTRLLGRHMIYPALAALAVAAELGIDLETAVARLAGLPPTPGRMELIPLENGATILGDYYKSGLETIHSALDFLAQIPAKRKIVVLGDISEPPGPQGPIYRAVGARVARAADLALFSSSHNHAYSSGATSAGLPRAAIIQMPRDVAAVTARLSELLRAGDVVLIKARDTQRFDRIALALAGRPVRCNLDFCRAMPTRCATCGMLKRGWDGLKVVF
jgi:UDP-N-acetylmuramyl pentapeptide synthase